MDMNAVQVKMLGEFSVSCGDAAVNDRNSRSRTARILLAYLIYHRGRMVSIDELVRVLDRSQKNTAPVAALRTALYRVRRMIEPLQERIGLPFIVSRSGRYGWNPDVPVELDAAEFEDMLREDTPACCQQALELYRGDFLRSLASEPWVEPLAEYYRNLYLTAVERAAPVLIESGLADKAADCCRSAISMAPYRETLYRCLIAACIALGDRESAKASYEELRAVLYKDLGIVPGDELRELYESTLLGAEEDALTPDSIQAQLREHSPVSGALICDYTSFKLFYQAEARAAARRGDAIHIGVLSVIGRGGRALASRSLARAMEQLHAHIEGSLRTGDIASCCSASQYILMLVQANYENSKLVCDRIIQAFYSAHPRSPIRIQSVVFPLEPMLRSGGPPEK